MADVPHLVKNLKAALCKGDFCVGDRTISIKPVEHLAKHDAVRDLKLAPKLKLSDLKSGHFDKMKVSGALHVFSNSVSSGLKFQ